MLRGRSNREWAKALHEVVQMERYHQDRKWGGADHDDKHDPADWYCLVVERINNAVNELQERDNMERFQRAEGNIIEAMALLQAWDESLHRQWAAARRAVYDTQERMDALREQLQQDVAASFATEEPKQS